MAGEVERLARGPLALDQAVAVGRQIADALICLVHRAFPTTRKCRPDQAGADQGVNQFRLFGLTVL